MKILVVKPSSLGDIIHALPTVNLLRRHFYHAKISWVVNDTLADILLESPVVDEVIPFKRDRWGSLFHLGEFLDFLGHVRDRRFDLVVDLQGLLRSGIITRATRAKRRIGLSDAREGAKMFYTETVRVPNARMHAVDRYLLMSQHLDAGREPVHFPLGHPQTARESVDNLLRAHGFEGGAKLVVVNTAARWDSKLWPSEHTSALLDAITAEMPDVQVALLGGPKDGERVSKIAAAATQATKSSRPPLNLAGKTSLSELVELLRRAAVLVTPDSGPMHIAAALDVPVIALFGATDPDLTGPYAHGGIPHKVLRSDVKCSPCLKPRCNHTPRMECMTQLEPKTVLREIMSAMQAHHAA